jgi:DNA-binding GntR family transcriptional regulator
MNQSRESDRIENELRRLILTLKLEPGQVVSESALMKRYDWGRTPLREAFQRLAEQSLVQIIPRQGVIITPLSVFDFIAMMDALAMVIGPAAALACQRLEKAELEQLEQIVAQSESAAEQRDFVTVAEQDYAFHRTLADATGNRYLRDYLLRLHQCATRFNFAAWQRDTDATPSMHEHHQIITALRARDQVRARQVMLAHIQNARTRVLGSALPADDFSYSDNRTGSSVN